MEMTPKACTLDNVRYRYCWGTRLQVDVIQELTLSTPSSVTTLNHKEHGVQVKSCLAALVMSKQLALSKPSLAAGVT